MTRSKMNLLYSRSKRSVAAALAALLMLAVTPFASAEVARIGVPLADPNGNIVRAVRAAVQGMDWYALDGHVHTDHSHDAGFFHQQEKRPEEHDTFVADQLAEAARTGEDIAVLTDHRSYDQAYDPDYRSESLTLMDGEEWGGYPHATAWGISEVLEQGTDDGTCGVARATSEVHAQDGIFGIAHPEDGRRTCISVESLADVPIDHLESFRAPHTTFWENNIVAGRRFIPATGSDNHFKQLYGTEGGVGGNSTFVMATAPTHAAIVAGVRAGRAFASTRALGPTVTTLLDADGAPGFEALTGGWSEPVGANVRVAFEVNAGVGFWLQVVNDRSEIVAQEPILSTPATIAYDLPATAKFYRAQIVAEPLQRVTGAVVHDYLSYADTLRILSAPVYLTEPAAGAGTQATDTGTIQALTPGAPFAGFADVASSGSNVVAVWQQRNGSTYEVALSRSADAGASWSEPVVISGTYDARMPSVAIDGAHVVVAFEAHLRTAHGGTIFALRSTDGGQTFELTAGVSAAPLGTRPSVAVSGAREHVAWMSMEDGYKIRYATRSGDEFSTPMLLSSAVARDGGMLSWVVPPKPIRHIPAAVHPTIAVDGDSVAVAWEDDREDPTPLRRGTPDDWGIYATFSTDGGQTWSSDTRVTPRHDHKPADPADPEALEGNPQRHAGLLFDGGALYLAYQDQNDSGGTVARVRRSDDFGQSWSAPAAASGSSSEFAYKPKLAPAAGGVRVVWQQSAGRAWSLRGATSSDGGASFGVDAAITTGSGYAGYPSVAGDVIVYTGQRGGLYGVFAHHGWS